MRRRYKTFATGLVLAISAATGSLVMSSGTAAAADPIVVGDCSTSVQGTPGTPISLSPSAVLDPVLSIVRAVPLIGGTLAGGVSSAVSGMGNIPIGTVPSANSTISGATIAAAATPRIRSAIQGIPLIGDVLNGIMTKVQASLTSGCGIVVTVVNTAAAPVQEGSKTVAGAIEKGAAALPLPGNPTNPTQPPGTTNPGAPGGSGPGGTNGGGNTGALPGSNQSVIGGVPSGGGMFFSPNYNFGRSPMADYSNLPFAKAGLFAPSPGVRYGGGVPGYSPQFGILGTNNDTDGVQAAGHADALTPVSGNRIAFPILLAVLALSGVTAALVRTWVLRRMTA
ncbi:hypothetical protein SAMN05192558_106406 [Actinokineospora alba]|uniref:Uncharacterized protein n=1 Tax=Actinokineospora alba TaxID=504798 RepID=A0A1H0Q4L3_9PSEU|nr:hypothetical protein [Actinokineospora alba]TDP66077.1 hypothetical protein C8E96_1573 [Actinokineospora alba]SDI58593.1 hypothetical protein SAMN05421871_10646 [Actinokineospora alba]SDP12357.1 hypothetical protein SAMN05192558_106406 [Actinokineospora alba]